MEISALARKTGYAEQLPKSDVRTLVLLSDVHTQPLVALGRSAVLEEVGEENLFGNLDDALDRAREHLGLPPADHPLFAVPTVARETIAGSGLLVLRGSSRTNKTRS